MKPPWSTNQLKRLGDALRDEAALPTSLPDYASVIAWYDDLAASVHERIEALDLGGAHAAEVQVSSRAKTIETLRDKLRREWPIRLPSIQDLAGVRVVADISLLSQDQVVETIAKTFGHHADAIRDLRDSPHSGYRAVHLWLRLEEGRVEVQVRTALQSSWANAYETLADLAGRAIRYGGEPQWVEGVPDSLRSAPEHMRNEVKDFAVALRRLSEYNIASIENTKKLIEMWMGGASAGLEVRSQVIAHIGRAWLTNPYLRDRPMPNVDADDPDINLEQMWDMVNEVQVATTIMMDELRRQLERDRAEIGRGRQ
jgi:ppGpp synthetase/RelA/SpoT-type nucleotidyltranferase